MPEINYDKIVEAVMETKAAPAAKETAAELVDSWIRANHEKDSAVKTLAVELGFHIWLDQNTLIIGVQDRIAEDATAPFGCEWKSAKEPKKNKDVSDSAWWNEEKWVQELSNGPQLSIYALAAHNGDAK